MKGERPDIMYSVKECARKVSAPTDEDFVAVKRILKYLSGTKGAEMRFSCHQAGHTIDVITDARLGRWRGFPQHERRSDHHGWDRGLLLVPDTDQCGTFEL
jgi:hypothetical protein